MKLFDLISYYLARAVSIIISLVIIGLACWCVGGFKLEIYDWQTVISNMSQELPRVGKLINSTFTFLSVPAGVAVNPMLEEISFGLLLAAMFKLTHMLDMTFCKFLGNLQPSSKLLKWLVDFIFGTVTCFASVMFTCLLKNRMVALLSPLHPAAWFIALLLIVLVVELIKVHDKGFRVAMAAKVSIDLILDVIIVILIYLVVGCYHLLPLIGAVRVSDVPVIICIVVGILGLTILGALSFSGAFKEKEK